MRPGGPAAWRRLPRGADPLNARRRAMGDGAHLSARTGDPVGTNRGPIVVCKFGGSSVADPVRLRAVAQRLVAASRAGCRVVAVLSAMGATTDELMALARTV